MAFRTRKLDSQIDIVTPENIAFEYRLAGPFLRLPAYLIDLGVRLLILIGGLIAFGLAFGLTGFGGLAAGVALLIYFGLEWFYGSLFEIFWNGQTPGKRALNLRVVSFDGQPITAMQAVLRNIARAVDLMPIFPLANAFSVPCGIVGLIACSVSQRNQRLGDIVCGTLVIVEERRQLRGLTNVNEPAVVQLAAEIPAGFVASRTLARAVGKYVQRRRKFTLQRRAEIARHIGAPLVEQFNLPPETSHDLLLCALYQRIFLSQPSGSRPEPSTADEIVIPEDLGPMGIVPSPPLRTSTPTYR